MAPGLQKPALSGRHEPYFMSLSLSYDREAAVYVQPCGKDCRDRLNAIFELPVTRKLVANSLKGANIMAQFEDINAFLDEHNYICLKGKYWDKMWKMLPNYLEVPKPLVLSGWHFSDDEEKRDRFVLHLIVANNTDNLAKLVSYLNRVPLEAWYKSDGSKKPALD